MSQIFNLNDPIQLQFMPVPAGKFLMGSNPETDPASRDNEHSQHTVYLSDFYIARTPIINKQYAVFVAATGHSPPPHWPDGIYPAEKADHPATHISYRDAIAFCQWLAEVTGRPMRLPTEAEWEKAARFDDGRLYPWGNEWDAALANTMEAGPGDTTPVGKYSPRGDSWCGAADMSGNVWEWCADWSSNQLYPERVDVVVRDPQGPATGRRRALRGGSFFLNRKTCRCAYRSRYHPDYHEDDTGFRVAMSAR